jgi:hypothetical protein
MINLEYQLMCKYLKIKPISLVNTFYIVKTEKNIAFNNLWKIILFDVFPFGKTHEEVKTRLLFVSAYHEVLSPINNTFSDKHGNLPFVIFIPLFKIINFTMRIFYKLFI